MFKTNTKKGFGAGAGLFMLFFCRSRKSFKCLDADAPENQQTDIPQVRKHKISQHLYRPVSINPSFQSNPVYPAIYQSIPNLCV